MKEKSWDEWRLFPGTDPERGANPDIGDEIDIECKDKLTKLQDVPLKICSIIWEGLPPNELSLWYDLTRWRHRDQATARRWKARRALGRRVVHRDGWTGTVVWMAGNWSDPIQEEAWKRFGEEGRGGDYIIHRHNNVARPYYYPDDLSDYDFDDAI